MASVLPIRPISISNGLQCIYALIHSTCMQNPEYYWNYESALDKFYIAQIHLFRKRTICSGPFAPQAGFLKQRNKSSGLELLNQPVAQWRSFAWRAGNKSERFADNLLCHEAIVFGAIAVCFVVNQSCLVMKQSCLVP
jgi:hypothetical protein